MGVVCVNGSRQRIRQEKAEQGLKLMLNREKVMIARTCCNQSDRFAHQAIIWDDVEHVLQDTGVASAVHRSADDQRVRGNHLPYYLLRISVVLMRFLAVAKLHVVCSDIDD